jgi:hypothetical protein
MTTVTAACPKCEQADSLSWYQGTENGAPHGAGYWPMPVEDFNQLCDCELDHSQLEAAERAAWAQLEDGAEEWAEDAARR